ncbi:MAG: hypothetical protein U0Z26_01670 [Anaerolineales bacterium]
MNISPMDLKKIKFSEVLLYCSVIAAIMWATYFSIVTIFIPYQIEYREGTAQVMTGILLKGGNPFTFDNQPLAMNNYGLGYSLAVLPFAALFGNTLLVHRSVTLFFVLLSAFLGYAVVQKKSSSSSFALICLAFIMIGLLGYGGVGAFPSSLGTFLFLFALFIPFLRSFDWIGLVVSLLSSLLAFYTKPYFLLAFGLIGSYLFLFVSKKKGILYGVVFLAGLITSLLMVNRLLPLYFINTFIGNASNTDLRVEHLVSQLRVLFTSFYPALILSTMILGMHFFNNRLQAKDLSNELLNASNWNAPFIKYSFDFPLYTFLCSLLVFVLVLGQHIGNYLNYAFQLLIPTFFCWFLIKASQVQSFRWVFVLGIIFNLYSWELNTLDPAMLEQKDSKEWAQVYDYLHASSLTLNSPAVAAEVSTLGQTPMDSGQTSYFYAVKSFPENLLTGTSYEKFYDDGFRYTVLIDRMIEKQKFDLVVTTKEKTSFYHSKILPKYYGIVDEIKVEMPHTNQFWTLVFWKPLR